MGSQGKFVALLRGINVGGKNIILKGQLRQAFEDMGFTGVRTLIQSGNILFRSVDEDIDAHMRKIELFLSERFSYNARAVVLSEGHFKSIVREAPDGWGVDLNYRPWGYIFTLFGHFNLKIPRPVFQWSEAEKNQLFFNM